MRIRPRVSPRLAPPAVVTRPRRPPRPRTSEFWYDGEEEEFDGVAADVRAKTVVLLPVNDGDDSSWIDQARSKLADRAFDACFCSSAALPAATRVWAGRDGPPFFLKPRVRPALDGDDVDAWWSEVAGQNWRVSWCVGKEGFERGRERKRGVVEQEASSLTP